MMDRLQKALRGHYAIRRQIGRGGMAVVYLADDLTQQRPVAIKVLRAELSAALSYERFLREIRIAARLSHPHILPLHDSGDADGLLYYVMPFVEGETLEDRLNREKIIPWDEASRIAREVASALGYAHAQGLVHRDIKPANLLLSQGYAVIADFGVARAVNDSGTGAITQAGRAVGTPTYMSPEQASADLAVDGRADIYALGCVLYEMLTGAPPFTGKNTQETLANILSAPTPPIQKPAHIPRGVREATYRALAKDPGERFATAAEFSEALLSEDAEPARARDDSRSGWKKLLPWWNA